MWQSSCLVGWRASALFRRPGACNEAPSVPGTASVVLTGLALLGAVRGRSAYRSIQFKESVEVTDRAASRPKAWRAPLEGTIETNPPEGGGRGAVAIGFGAVGARLRCFEDRAVLCFRPRPRPRSPYGGRRLALLEARMRGSDIAVRFGSLGTAPRVRPQSFRCRR